jgi:hypothetical protein
MLTPKVRPQVDNLPRAQSNQHAHGSERKPLDALICALVRISQLLLACPQIVHLRHNLTNRLLNAPELHFHRLQLLAGRNGIPVLGIGAYVNVKLDVARLVRLGGARVYVFETDVEGGVFVGGKGVAVLADDVFGTVVVVAHGVADLCSAWLVLVLVCCVVCRFGQTHVHVYSLTIASVSVQNRSNND